MNGSGVEFLEIFFVLLAVGVLWLIRPKPINTNVVCEQCYTIGKVKKATPGSGGVELLLWLLILPGLMYGLWRAFKRHEVCAKCGSTALVPLDTPKGRQLQVKMDPPPKVVGRSRNFFSPVHSKTCSFCQKPVPSDLTLNLCPHCGTQVATGS